MDSDTVFFYDQYKEVWDDRKGWQLSTGISKGLEQRDAAFRNGRVQHRFGLMRLVEKVMYTRGFMKADLNLEDLYDGVEEGVQFSDGGYLHKQYMVYWTRGGIKRVSYINVREEYQFLLRSVLEKYDPLVDLMCIDTNYRPMFVSKSKRTSALTDPWLSDRLYYNGILARDVYTRLYVEDERLLSFNL